MNSLPSGKNCQLFLNQAIFTIFFKNVNIIIILTIDAWKRTGGD